jgi:hypothetical protein
VVRAQTADPAALIPAIRRELVALDSTIPAVFAVYTDVVAASLARHRLGAIVLVDRRLRRAARELKPLVTAKVPLAPKSLSR